MILKIFVEARLVMVYTSRECEGVIDGEKHEEVRIVRNCFVLGILGHGAQSQVIRVDFS